MSGNFRAAEQGPHERIVAAMRERFGERFGDVRVDESERLIISVIDPTPADHRAAARAAVEVGIPGGVVIAEFEGRWVEVWDELRERLEQLDERVPHVFHWRAGGAERRQPPYHVALAAHAENVAAELWDRFGPYLEMTVGMLPYPVPPGYVRPERARRGRPKAEPVPIGASEITVGLRGELVVPRGHGVTAELIVTNHSAEPLELWTGAFQETEVVDPVGGRVVGGDDGNRNMIGRRWYAEPGGSVVLPLRVGSASYEADLGYALPAGTWAVRATLELADGRRFRTQALPLTVVA